MATRQIIVKEVVEKDESGKVVALHATLTAERDTKRTTKFFELSKPNVLGVLYVQQGALELLGKPESIEVIIKRTE